MELNRKKWGGALLLFLAAFIWGTSFVAQDVGAETVDGFTYQAVRNLLGAVVLLPLCFVFDAVAKKRGTYRAPTKESRKYLFLGGATCGVFLCVAVVLQQFGIANNVTSPGKDAFITALYIVFVPVLGLFFGKRAQPHVYLCVITGLVGLWMLCMGGSGITVGDIQVILCSVAFSCHIMMVDFVVPHVDGVKLSCIQFFVAAFLSGICMFIFEEPDMKTILAAWWPLVYSGVFSAAGGYTLQILGQKSTPPAVACLIMSLESVFAVISSMILLPGIPTPTAREWIGMVLIFAAIIVSQIPVRYPSKKGKQTENRDTVN